LDSDLSSRTSLKLFFDHPLAFRPLGKMFSPNSNGCGRCGIHGILGVLADGSFALCGIGENVPELIFVHISTSPLREVWNANRVLTDIRKGLPGRLEGICGSCIMQSLCLGSCIAQNYYRRKDLWAPFWYCEQAEMAGLFPGSRKKNV
jgi:SynChlorMet cassette radical SAM/SPASM protein ScmF